jgi:prepilin-type N-terminal cleavage/methylation domain-containing protein
MLTHKKIVSNDRCKGFTLVELMIAVAVSGLVLTAVATTYINQNRHYNAQLDVTMMQQNIRASLYILTRDIRMAGFEKFGSGKAQIVDALPDLFSFTVDLNEDGDTDDAGENIAYDLYNSGETGTITLGRSTSGSAIVVSTDPVTSRNVAAADHEPAVENIEQLEFFYLDKDGDPTTVEKQVRTVVLSVLARADKADRNYTNTQTYTPASNLALYNNDTLSGTSWTVNDNFRRRMQIMRVECRNVGL